MTECIKTLQQTGLRSNVWRKCLAVAGLLLAVPLFFSCKQTVQSGGAMHFDIVYELDGGKNNPENPKTYTTDKLPVTLKAPSKEPKGNAKYEFEGWYTDKAFTKKIEKITAGTTGIVTLYAKWKTSEVQQGQVSYKVEHWLQEVNSATGMVFDGTKHESPNYKLADTDGKLVGKEGTETKAAAKDYQGFDKPSVKQEKITADGKTVVKIYYLRKTITLTFDPDGGTIDGKSGNTMLSGKFGEKYTQPANLVKNGLKFSAWNPELKGNTFPAEDASYKAIWIDKDEYTYRVEHWLQEIDPATGKVYNGDTHEAPNYKRETSEPKHGKAGKPTEAVVNEYTGFVTPAAADIHQETIKKDDSTVVKIYYLRKTITLTFDPDGGTIDGKTEKKALSGKFGEKLSVANPSKIGFKFSVWQPALFATFPSQDTSYKAVWVEGTKYKYTVEHWRQKIDTLTGKVYDGNDHTNRMHWDIETEQLSGKAGETTNAVAKKAAGDKNAAYTGFDEPTVTQKTIEGEDGKTVVSIYYLRKQVTLTFDPNGGTLDGSSKTKQLSGRFGESKVGGAALQDAIHKPVKGSMKFAGWKFESKIEPYPPATFPEKDYTYTAQWEDPQSAQYKVIHKKQPVIGDNYNLDTDVVEETGTVGEETNAVAKTYDHFHLSTVNHPGSKIIQKKIEAGGKTVVEIFYDRDEYTVTFKLNNGGTDIEAKGRYGAELIKPTPMKDGMDFDKWVPDVPATFEKTTTYTATWKPKPAQTATYKVEHWRQKLNATTGKVYGSEQNDTNYERWETEKNKSGTVGTQTTAAAKDNYEGFVKPTNIQQATITADGNTVVKIYYVRKQVELTFDPNGGKFGTSTEPKKVQGKYGEKITEAEVGKPEKDDAKFAEWKPLFPLPNTFPKIDATYQAEWITLVGLIIEPPTQTVYTAGDAFNPAGMRVKAKYSDGSSGGPLLVYGTDYTTNFDSIKDSVGEHDVTVTYKSVTGTFKVTIQAKPAATFDFGDIIDKDGKKYKKDVFALESGKTWQDYYVIISVTGTTYVGAQYQVDDLGYVLTSSNASFTYNTAALAKSGNRYLTKGDVTNILANKEAFNESIQKTGLTPPMPEFTAVNILYKDLNTFYDGTDAARFGPTSSGQFVPIAARTFN